MKYYYNRIEKLFLYFDFAKKFLETIFKQFYLIFKFKYEL